MEAVCVDGTCVLNQPDYQRNPGVENVLSTRAIRLRFGTRRTNIPTAVENIATPATAMETPAPIMAGDSASMPSGTTNTLEAIPPAPKTKSAIGPPIDGGSSINDDEPPCVYSRSNEGVSAPELAVSANPRMRESMVHTPCNVRASHMCGRDGDTSRSLPATFGCYEPLIHTCAIGSTGCSVTLGRRLQVTRLYCCRNQQRLFGSTPRKCDSRRSGASFITRFERRAATEVREYGVVGDRSS